MTKYAAEWKDENDVTRYLVTWGFFLNENKSWSAPKTGILPCNKEKRAIEFSKQYGYK